ncbi:MAG: hypothetical protein CSA82_02825 [Actinobacteria bacterium]|nr:MAG: hypothetical protein CSA82_02825 [Actinomycetota bacterium]
MFFEGLPAAGFDWWWNMMRVRISAQYVLSMLITLILKVVEFKALISEIVLLQQCCRCPLWG